MNDKINIFYTWLDERKEATLSEAAALTKDERIDEGNSLKAKANIYDICKAVCGAAVKQSKGMPDADMLVAAFKRITDQWRTALDLAKAHNDSRKIMIEEAKLSAADEITDRIRETV